MKFRRRVDKDVHRETEIKQIHKLSPPLHKGLSRLFDNQYIDIRPVSSTLPSNRAKNESLLHSAASQLTVQEVDNLLATEILNGYSRAAGFENLSAQR